MKKIVSLILTYIIAILIVFLLMTGAVWLVKIAVDFWRSFGWIS